jgi:MYXO-CTERM domain-containing protein
MMARLRPWLWAPLFLYMAALLFGSIKTGGPAIGSDVVLHVIGYGGMAVLVLLASQGFLFPARAVSLGIAFVVTFAYGAAMEGVQAFVPGRHASTSDLIANAAGAALALAGVGLIGLLRSERRKNETAS